MDMSRRGFVETLALAGGGAMTVSGAAMGGDRMSDEILKEKIRRARLSGPSMVTAEATVAGPPIASRPREIGIPPVAI
jgi:hypothetical protein